MVRSAEVKNYRAMFQSKFKYAAALRIVRSEQSSEVQLHPTFMRPQKDQLTSQALSADRTQNCTKMALNKEPIWNLPTGENVDDDQVDEELHDHGQAISQLTTTMNQLAKALLQQVQGPIQVNAMEGVNMMINKRRQHGQQMQSRPKQFMKDDSGYDKGDSFNEQEEKVQYVNNYQGQRNNAQGKTQQQWLSQGNQENWNNQGHQGNWSGGNNEQGNWNNKGNQGNWGGNHQGTWGGNSQGGWNNNNNRG
ncbi:PREDICTED: putative uncharacterized protein DDB_G0286901 [Nicotiana attenuata]|uniref:putative uncharacterized protein DDB_G0286901 n=1 Tax=Nicotiana attenuata TaxID=49451 RepID=UPI00090565E5|nr:PREDICTED: putative uncharacterized protein DDB_G0286901 [Nicotiana attenuata]XP_019240094.1 PREDICTED: putative uncharacterized protein DDB_G0286901 [Nicotiana attenuata]